MIEGKCKADFNKWLVEKYDHKEKAIYLEGEYWYLDVLVEDLPFEMQSGVYLEFFDSVGIHIETLIYGDENGWRFMFDINDSCDEDGKFYTRQEALMDAITKANEIYNNK